MKRWIGTLLLGIAAANASWAQSPAFNQLIPWAPTPSPLPALPELPSISNTQNRAGAQFPGVSVPMPQPPIVQQPNAPSSTFTPIDLNAPYMQPIEAPPSPSAIMGDNPIQGGPQPGTRFWVNADYLLWFEKKGPQPNPLVTTGSPLDNVPGALNQPNTQTLYGGKGLSYNPFSGIRTSIGLWFGPDNRFGFEATGFILDQKATQFLAGGGVNGSPFLARPYVNAFTGAQDAFYISQNFPSATNAPQTGGIDVSSNSRTWGYDLDGMYNAYRGELIAINFLGGFQMTGLNEKLHLSESLRNLTPYGFGVTYLGAPVPSFTRELTFDKFDTLNTFFGPQLGSRAHFQSGAWALDFTGKVGIGVIQQQVNIQGLTAIDGLNGKLFAVTPGGVYATSSNSGDHIQNQFGVIPQGNVDLSYALTNNIVFKMGYTFLFMNSVVRPGNQIDTTVNPNLVPSSSAVGASGGPDRPSFEFHTTSFWAQGVNFAVELRY